MTDMSAFEHQVETVLRRAAGPSQPVDAAAVVQQLAAETRSGPVPSHTRRILFRKPLAPTEGGSSMYSALRFAAAAAVLLLVGGLLLTGVVNSPTNEALAPGAVTTDPSPTPTGDPPPDEAQAFPTGMFVSTGDDRFYQEFLADGTGRTFIYPNNVEVQFEYTVEGGLVAFPSLEDGEEGMTERWAYEGEILSLVPLGEVSSSHPSVVAGIDWRLVPDPVEVVVAGEEIEAGGTVYSSWAVMSIESAAEAGPDAYTEVTDVMGRIAAVPIAQGQPITPEMLEPPE